MAPSRHRCTRRAASIARTQSPIAVNGGKAAPKARRRHWRRRFASPSSLGDAMIIDCSRIARPCEVRGSRTVPPPYNRHTDADEMPSPIGGATQEPGCIVGSIGAQSPFLSYGLFFRLTAHLTGSSGYLQSDTGTINQLLHLWKFEDDADRRAHWAAVFANRDFVEGLALKFRPLPMTQEVKLLQAAPWGPHP
jgi:hypothetical protein